MNTKSISIVLILVFVVLNATDYTVTSTADIAPGSCTGATSTPYFRCAFDAAVVGSGNAVILQDSLGAGPIEIDTSLGTMAAVAFDTTINGGNNTIQVGVAVNPSQLFSIDSGIRLIFDGASSFITYSGLIAGAGGIRMPSTAGIVLITGATASYTGGATLIGGTLRIGSGGIRPWDQELGTIELQGTDIVCDGGLTLKNLFDLGTGVTTSFAVNPNGFSIEPGGSGPGIIQGSGSIDWSVSGGGSASLNIKGTNTYSGNTTVGTGISLFCSSPATPFGSGTVTFAADSSFYYGFGDPVAITNNFILQGNSSNSVVFGGNGGPWAIAGIISGTGRFEKSNGDGGTIQFTNSSNNTFTGGIVLGNGTLEVGSQGGNPWDLSVFGGDITNNRAILSVFGTFTFSNPNFYVASYPQTKITVDTSETVTIASLVRDSFEGGVIYKLGNGTVILSNTGNTYTAGTYIDAGVVSISADGCLGTGSITLNGGTLRTTATFSSAKAIALTADGIIDVNTGTTFTESGVISGGFDLTKTNAGTLILSGTNTYSGGTTTITDGTLSISADANLGDAANTITLNGGTLNTSATFSSARNITLSADGTIDVNTGTTFTESGVISGGFDLTKTNAGTLILSGTNIYTGATAISAGTLALSGGGSISDSSSVTNSGVFDISDVTTSATINTLSGSGNVVLGGKALTVIQGSDGTVSGIISGSGGDLTKAGSSTLTLSGINTYTGATVISAGTIALSGSGAIATSASVTNSGIFDISDVTTSATINTLSGSGNVMLGSKALTVIQGSLGTVSGIISGSGGSFSKQGSATLIFANTSNNTYTGGTTISEGTLQVGSGGGTPWELTSGVITIDGSTLDFRGNFSMSNAYTLASAATISTSTGVAITLEGVVSGAGSLVKTGSGTLLLSAANTYSAGTTVTAGTLFISSDGNLGTGNITLNGGTLSLTATLDSSKSVALSAASTISTASSTTSILSGVFSGASLLTKSGAGILQLTGSSAGFTGGITVSTGTLSVLGNFSGAPVTISSGAILRGTGSVGTTVNNGTLYPGASIGTLTIAGDYTQASDATLEIEIDNTPANDKLVISGAANLDGTLALVVTDGLYTAGTTFVFIEAAGGVNGTFSSVTGMAPVNYTIDYEPTTVSLIITSSHFVPSPPVAGLTGNARAVGDYLYCENSLIDNDPLEAVQVKLLFAADFALNLNRLSGSTYTALPLIELENNTHLGFITTEQMGAFIDADVTCHSLEHRFFLWAVPVVMTSKQVMYDQFRFNSETYGLETGISLTLDAPFYFGLSVGYTHTNIGWEQNLGHGDNDTFYIGPFFGFFTDSWYFGTLVQAAVNRYNIHRIIDFAGIDATPRSHFPTYNLLNSLELAYFFRGLLYNSTTWGIKPRINGTFLQNYFYGFRETGAESLNLVFDKKNSYFFRLLTDVQFEMKVNLHNTDVLAIPYITFGLMKTTPIGAMRYVVNFDNLTVCSPNYTIEGYTGSTLLGTLDIGLNFEWLQNSLLGLRYFLSVGKNYINNEAILQLSLRF